MSFGQQGLTYALSVGASSGGVAHPVVSAQKCRIVNTNTTLHVGVTFGVTSATAVLPAAGSPANAIIVPANSTVIVDVPVGSNYVAMIGSAAGPSLVFFSFGGEN